MPGIQPGGFQHARDSAWHDLLSERLSFDISSSHYSTVIVTNDLRPCGAKHAKGSSRPAAPTLLTLTRLASLGACSLTAAWAARLHLDTAPAVSAL